jgi:hypothetical protein
MQDLAQLLRENPYPGRGIVVGHDRVYYWIMGRSSNSRNRVFVHDRRRHPAPKPTTPASWKTPASSSTIPCAPWETRSW